MIIHFRNHSFLLFRVTVCLAAFALLLHDPSSFGQAPSSPAEASTTTLPRILKLPPGFEVERVAGPPLIDRPICADLDHLGCLYLVESNGSNEDVRIQYQKKPHRVIRLVDSDGDGRFDTRTIFADGMAFPEGAMWRAGSLYVAAPPQIWKLTDTDQDGVADQREVWFDGKSLGHCANDLHGPFLGPDGWIYWCKGAWAEQTYERPGKKTPLVTRASHMFRRHPDGGVIEPVMTGGMDNPVEVAFTPTGERIFTTTFLQHPGDGKRDGLIHAIYGGVYGKEHGVLEGHARTGNLMPILTHLGAAAPCGLTRLRSDQLGEQYRNNLLACCFNMHKVTRHALVPAGATFTTNNEDFVSSPDLDFHPTDVLEDADGSILVVDTGGWYKLCCPTSQLYKPDILGGVYRVRRQGSHRIDDPRGLRLRWQSLSARELAEFLGDPRSAVRLRAKELLAQHAPDQAVEALTERLADADPQLRRRAVWALTEIQGDAARQAVRQALNDQDAEVRQVAANSVSVWRDAAAATPLVPLLKDSSPPTRRAAAEALGRLGNPAAIEPLLQAAEAPLDRTLEHALIYALIEINAPEPTAAGLKAPSPHTRRVALLALDQMEAGNLTAEQVAPLLTSREATLRDCAWWLLERHPQWSSLLASYVHDQLRKPRKDDAAGQAPSPSVLARLLARGSNEPSMQRLIADGVKTSSVPAQFRGILLDAIQQSRLKQLPGSWSESLGELLASKEQGLVSHAVSALKPYSATRLDDSLLASLREISSDVHRPAILRMQALAITQSSPGNRPSPTGEISPTTMQFVGDCLKADQPVSLRSAAVDVLTAARLSDAELTRVARTLSPTSPTDLRQLLKIFEKSRAPQVGQALLSSLSQSAAVSSLDADELRKLLARFGDQVQREAQPLVERLRRENQEKLQQLDAVLGLLDDADARRGQRIFQSAKAACSACHQMGYLGGRVGPDLSRIGGIRSERDLLESLMFPSASFVRSYEPVTIATSSGKVFNGIVRDESSQEIVLALDAERTVRLAVEDVEERQPSPVSIMPAGLDKQFTPQQLADLILFLKTSR